MSVTIHVNGSSNSLVHKGSGGIAKSTLPDVCKTPSPGGPVPVPYPVIVSMSSDLSKGTKTVLVDGGNSAAVKGSEFSRCTGDEPGTAGGVKSSTNMKEATWLLFSFDVKMEGKNACRLSDKMQMNHGNTVCMAGVTQKPVSGPSIVDLVKDCEESKKAFEAAKKENGGKDPTVVVGTTSSGFDAETDIQSGTITIDQNTDKCTQVESLCFELNNLARKSEFEAADKSITTVKREEFIRAQEKIEYDGLQDTLKAIDKCKDEWGCKNHKFDLEGFKAAKNFDDYYKNFLRNSHKEHYGKWWDSVNSP